MNIENYLRSLANKIDRKTIKERSLILIGTMVTLWLLWQILVGNHINQINQKISSKITKIKQEIANLQGQVSQFSSALSNDPIIKLQQQVKELEGSNIDLLNKLENMSDLFISPQLMTSLLKEILVGANLEIISLKSIPPVPFVPVQIEDNKDNRTKFKVYKHQIELILLGSFFQITDFVAKIEQMPHKLLWEELEFVVTEYPKAQIKVIVSSLSFNAALLSVP